MKLFTHSFVTKVLNSLEKLPKFLRVPFYSCLRSLWLLFVWYPNTANLKNCFSNFIVEGDLVFDIGANKGMLTEIFLKLGARVVCVEPLPDCYKILTRKFGNNKNVTIIQKGVGDQEGELTLFVNEKNPALSTFSESWKQGRHKDEKWAAEVIVPMITMDSLIKAHGRPQFCKIDVEGFEYQVLMGLNEKLPYFSFEFLKENTDSLKKCIERIGALGKASYSYSDENAGKLEMEWDDEEMLIDKITSRMEDDLSGDIYVKMDIISKR